MFKSGLDPGQCGFRALSAQPWDNTAWYIKATESVIIWARPPGAPASRPREGSLTLSLPLSSDVAEQTLIRTGGVRSQAGPGQGAFLPGSVWEAGVWK